MSRLSPRTRLLVAVLACATLVGLVAAKVNTSGQLQVAAATTHVLVDLPDASIVEQRALPQHVGSLQKRAELFGRLMTTDPVLDRIAKQAGIPPGSIGATARTTAPVTITLTEPNSEERASQIRDSKRPYHLELQADPAEPVLDVYAQAPSAPEAQRLADDSVVALRAYLDATARAEGVPARDRVRIRQLGAARAGVVNARAPLVIGVLTFFVAFALFCAAALALVLLRQRRIAKPAGDDEATPPDEPVRVDAPKRAAAPSPSPSKAARRALADWPRTTRPLPWLLAGFIAMLWLVPFNTIQLGASMPIDLKLDRLVLPFVVVAFVVAVVAGGKAAPRLRFTWIHVALAAFVGCAFLSVVLEAHSLNQLLEFELALKKLPLLIAYVSVFLIVASAVRPSEVRPFMNYTLILAVLCGLGIIWQYRTDQNLFSMWSQQILPGAFKFAADSGGVTVDSLGRRGISGPTQAGLEAVSMLSMALPIALVGLMRGGQRKDQILYGLAACILVAAMFATGRKSALLAPLAVILTIAYFRRRELLSLAPVGLLIAIVVSALSPGAVHGTITQFVRPDRASVATTSDRTADYDAVRPDVWSHLLFGRGYGSYDHQTYRILDSEILTRLVETGVVGLLAFLLVGIAVVLVARRTIAGRDPTYAPLALAGVAAAVCFLVVSTLFDVLSFPHATYIFLYMAGLVSVVVLRDPEVAAVTLPIRGHGGRVRGARPIKTQGVAPTRR